jgi:hypothetical protein
LLKEPGPQPPDWRKFLHDYVLAGGGLFLGHDSVGHWHALRDPLFPEIMRGTGWKPIKNYVVRETAHPVTSGLKREFCPAFLNDSVIMEAGPEGTVLLVDNDNDPALIVGKAGLGKVAGLENVVGWGPYAPTAEETALLVNIVTWLGTREEREVSPEVLRELEQRLTLLEKKDLPALRENLADMKRELERKRKDLYNQMQVLIFSLKEEIKDISRKK